MIDHNKWIKESLESLDNVKKVKADDQFLRKMEEMVLTYKKPENKVNALFVWSIAASFTLIIMANIAIFKTYCSDEYVNNQTDIKSELSSDYLLIPAKNIYDE